MKVMILLNADSRLKNNPYICVVFKPVYIMKKRFVFLVEKKIGMLPDITWKKVFEVEKEFEIDSSFEHYVFPIKAESVSFDVAPSMEQVIHVLHYLYPGDHRVTVISD